MRVRKCHRWFLVAAAVLGCLVIVVSFLAYQILNAPANVPGDLSDSDKKRIVRLARWHTLTSATLHFAHGELRQGIQAFRVFPKQQINELRENPDGSYRSYVVVFNDNEPDGSGFYAWSRLQLIKTNSAWRIIRSY
jgi:hypothetical protein